MATATATAMAAPSLLDALYCQEEQLDLEDPLVARDHTLLASPRELPCSQPREENLEDEWIDTCSSLLAREAATQPDPPPLGAEAGELYLGAVRLRSVEWMSRAAARQDLSPLTVLLAVNYLDRCFLLRSGPLRLQGDRPWMGRLAAVACLSLAAKVEETHAPLLLDLQLSVAPPPPPPSQQSEEGAGYLFEEKTVRRMELLVLSALGWRMYPVTALSFIHPLLPILCSKNRGNNQTAMAPAAAIASRLRGCEAALLSVIADWRWVRYPSSVWAMAALLHALDCNGESHHLFSLLKAPKEKVEECYKLISESMGVGHKRNQSHCSSYNHYAPPSCPSGVIGSCFSCES